MLSQNHLSSFLFSLILAIHLTKVTASDTIVAQVILPRYVQGKSSYRTEANPNMDTDFGDTE